MLKVEAYLDADFADDTEYNERDEPIAPGGKVLAKHLQTMLEPIVRWHYGPEQHDDYGWDLVGRWEGNRVWVLVHGAIENLPGPPLPHHVSIEVGVGCLRSPGKQRRATIQFSLLFEDLVRADPKTHILEWKRWKEAWFGGHSDWIPWNLYHAAKEDGVK